MSGLLPSVVVLAGGLGHERDVSVRSGRRVSEVLAAGGHDVRVLDADATLLEQLASEPPDVVWPALHGAEGEDGALREVLDSLRVPYVGTGPASSRLAWDKPIASTLVAAAGLRVPEQVALPHSTFRELGAGAVMAALVARLGLPVVVKPARGGSALGLTVVTDELALPRALMDCFAYGEVALVQRLVVGTEVAVSVLDIPALRALPAVEIVPDGGVYDYEARYTAGATEFHCPARLDDAATAAVAAAACLAHTALGLRDLSRTDLVVDSDGVPWFLEVAVSPGTTETSLLPQAVLAAGGDLGGTYSAVAVAAAARAR